MSKDPVCGMMVDEKKATGKSEYQGKTYHFCSTHCKAEFDRDPGKYLSGQGHGGMDHMGHHGGHCC